MTYTIKLSKSDTECLRQTVSEAYRAGKDEMAEKHAGGSETTLSNMQDYYARLLKQIEQQAQYIAEEAFEAGRKAPPLG